MSRLTRDGTAEPVLRDQIVRHARGQGNIHFSCSADHEQDWQPYPVDPQSAIQACDNHTCIHTYIGAQHKRPDHRMTSYNRALEITRCESIETTLRTRRLLWAGTLLRMSGRRLPKRIMFGNLEGAVRRGRGGKEKEWTDCVQSDIRAFGITGDWKAMALKAEVWVEAVREGGRRFMAA